MTLRDSHLAGWITLYEPPTWQCPRCGGGPLQFDRNNFHFREIADTANSHGELWFDPEMIVERFAGFAVCPNRACQEPVLISGYTRNELRPDPEEYAQVLHQSLRPTQVVPAPPVIDIPEHCPADVTTAIRRAFDLHWTDAAATANAIRIAVEGLMNHFHVPRTGKGKPGKRVPLPLHNRIDHAFRNAHPDSADTLLAIKWIGNAGSHVGKTLSDDAVVDAFDLLDHALQELFVNQARAKRVRRIAKAVNKAKKPRKQVRSSRPRKR